MENFEGDGMSLMDEMDCRSHNSSPVRRRAQQRLNRVRGALNRSCSVPDSNNPPSCLSPPAHGDISVPVSDLTEIGAEEEHPSCRSVWSNRLQRLDRGKSCESYPHCSAEDCGELSEAQDETLYIEETDTERLSDDCVQDLDSSCQNLELEQASSGRNSLYIPNNYMTKSMLCLNEESQDEVSRLCLTFPPLLYA